MPNKPNAVKLAESALVQKVSEEMVILDVNNGQYYTLNEVAADMVELVRLGSSTDEIVNAICSQYDAKESEVEADLHALLATLLDKQLVYSVD
ncbi:PqqD family protein [Alteromonas sp. BMJM2]|uniref:PqqD family protein n=1 Tax=Alteromonas sp. BMJM2 TaxID=2954241 RepID=UPI0022B42230|nr:PqqD family protein [Alteromonas sp. BMJM2]